MNKFVVTSYAQLAAVFKSLIGNYEGAQITLETANGNKCVYVLPDVTKNDRKWRARDERVKQYAGNAAKLAKG